LLVDADRVRASAIAPQGFETIAWQARSASEVAASSISSRFQPWRSNP
jgi:hypothetical protein